jgi:hypothetical protein
MTCPAYCRDFCGRSLVVVALDDIARFERAAAPQLPSRSSNWQRPTSQKFAPPNSLGRTAERAISFAESSRLLRSPLKILDKGAEPKLDSPISHGLGGAKQSSRGLEILLASPRGLTVGMFRFVPIDRIAHDDLSRAFSDSSQGMAD